MREKTKTEFPGETMRGKRSTTLNEEAERCAEKMGFFWLKNTLPDLPFNAFTFRLAVIAAVRLKKVRYEDETDEKVNGFYDGEEYSPYHRRKSPWEMVPTPDKNPY
jgi:hypothetical protein